MEELDKKFLTSAVRGGGLRKNTRNHYHKIQLTNSGKCNFRFIWHSSLMVWILSRNLLQARIQSVLSFCIISTCSRNWHRRVSFSFTDLRISSNSSTEPKRLANLACLHRNSLSRDFSAFFKSFTARRNKFKRYICKLVNLPAKHNLICSQFLDWNLLRMILQFYSFS